MDIYTRNRVQRPDWRPALCSPLLRRLRSLDHIGLLEPRSWETSLGDTVRLCLKKKQRERERKRERERERERERDLYFVPT
jgi:hypothetical protein